MRFIFPIILIVASIASFVLFTNPTYSEIKKLNVDAASYSSALDNSLKLQKVRDALSSKFHAFPQDSLDRLSKLLPDSVNNITLIIDIQRIAQGYGMTINNVKFDAPTAATSADQFAGATPGAIAEAAKEYGTFNLEFSTEASYGNFLKFIGDLEKSLRVVDISSVTFSSSDTNVLNSYKYNIKIKTYWLKN